MSQTINWTLNEIYYSIYKWISCEQNSEQKKSNKCEQGWCGLVVKLQGERSADEKLKEGVGGDEVVWMTKVWNELLGWGSKVAESFEVESGAVEQDVCIVLGAWKTVMAGGVRGPVKFMKVCSERRFVVQKGSNKAGVPPV